MTIANVATPARRFKVVANATMLIWRVLRVGESRFRRLDAPELLADVYEGRRVQRRQAHHAREREGRLMPFTHFLTQARVIVALALLVIAGLLWTFALQLSFGRSFIEVAGDESVLLFGLLWPMQIAQVAGLFGLSY